MFESRKCFPQHFLAALGLTLVEQH
jgi:hypothetical protein